VAIPLLDLRAQYLELKPELDAAISEVMSTAGFIGGPHVIGIEAEIAEYCGTSHAVACGNGTDALFLIMHALDIRAGDEVITTPFTFIATAEAIAHVGAVPVFVDIEPDTYNIDVTRIEAAITERTRAIMPVHIFGQCADMDPLRDIAAAHGLRVVEDACQAIGATYRDARAGSLGDVAAFSFFPSKNLGCAGDGGIITTDDGEIAAACRKMANHGTTVKYFHDAVGVNSRLDALQAAILRIKLPHLDRWNAERRTAAAIYDELLAGLPLTLSAVRDFGESVYHLYIVASPERDRLIAALTQAGIGGAAYYPRALHHQEAFAYLGYAEGSLPVAERVSEQTFAIPCFPGITREQQSAVANVLREALGG